MKAADFKEVKTLLSHSSKGKNLTKKSFKNILSSKYHANFVAIQSKKIVGVIFGLSDGGDVGYLYKLEVHPEFRRKKIGTNLVKQALKTWKTYNLRLIFGRITKSNLPYKRVLEKNNFTMLSEEYRLIDFDI